MRVRLVIPVYNDWKSLSSVLSDVNDAAAASPQHEFSVSIVNDASTEEVSVPGSLAHLKEVEVIHLVANFGHQRALACALGALCARGGFDRVLLMDGDGEDRVADVAGLVEESARHPKAVVVARRKKRSEGWRFRLSYLAYKWGFRLATGRRIDFGNFMVLPPHLAEQLAHSQFTGSHLAATVTRLRLPTRAVNVVRGSRYDGRSQMSYVSLVLHGLSAISVFSETVLTRSLLFLGAMGAAGAGGILVVWGVRSFTDLAIPGWATYVSLALLALILQALMGALFLTFLSLALRQIPAWIPAVHAAASIRAVERVK